MHKGEFSLLLLLSLKFVSIIVIVFVGIKSCYEKHDDYF